MNLSENTYTYVNSELMQTCSFSLRCVGLCTRVPAVVEAAPSGNGTWHCVELVEKRVPSLCWLGRGTSFNQGSGSLYPERGSIFILNGVHLLLYLLRESLFEDWHWAVESPLIFLPDIGIQRPKDFSYQGELGAVHT